MLLGGWGRYPLIESQILTPLTVQNAQNQIKEANFSHIIPRGMGRSYGDSSLSANVFQTAYLNHFLDFDHRTGVLRCQSGVSLDDILRVFVPCGWFLNITPGTRYVSVGGAVASDVHGKNHHIDGCFSEQVKSLRILLANDEIVDCSHSQNSELFYATCGGMGLTGLILEVELLLKSVPSSFIDETIIKAGNLQHVMDLFEENSDSTYSVAWIDCIASGSNLGRSLLMLGEHSKNGGYQLATSKKISVPVDMPAILLNKYTVSTFNSLYYHRIRQSVVKHTVHYEPYFYPLDGINDWNRLYGKKGFTQYQFVIPKENGMQGMNEILSRIVASGRGSFLAVLKAFGCKNKNYLSFPIAGYTLALDFKIDKGLFEFLDELDQIVIDYGGRVYLTKDVRLKKSAFRKMYPEWEYFREIREKFDATSVFNSLQSERLGI